MGKRKYPTPPPPTRDEINAAFRAEATDIRKRLDCSGLCDREPTHEWFGMVWCEHCLLDRIAVALQERAARRLRKEAQAESIRSLLAKWDAESLDESLARRAQEGK